MSVDVLMGADEVQGGDDFEILARELGKQKAFWGGINSDVTLASGSEEQLEQAVLRALRTLGTNSGLVLWPVWSVYHQISWAQVEALVRVWQRYRS
jgi:uroporphyrinogen-III decarboxylase